MNKTIEQRATDYSHRNGNEFLSGFERAEQEAYIQGATDQKAIDDEKYRNDIHYVGAKREELIDRACDYLRDNIDPQLVICHDNTWLSLDEFIEQFRKAINQTI